MSPDCPPFVPRLSPDCPPEKEIEKESDTETELEIESNKETDTEKEKEPKKEILTAHDAAACRTEGVRRIIQKRNAPEKEQV